METPEIPSDEPRPRHPRSAPRRRVYVTAGLTASAAVIALSVQASPARYGDPAPVSAADTATSAPATTADLADDPDDASDLADVADPDDDGDR